VRTNDGVVTYKGGGILAYLAAESANVNNSAVSNGGIGSDSDEVDISYKRKQSRQWRSLTSDKNFSEQIIQ
jgi:hypothetical protein